MQCSAGYIAFGVVSASLAPVCVTCKCNKTAQTADLTAGSELRDSSHNVISSRILMNFASWIYMDIHGYTWIYRIPLSILSRFAVSSSGLLLASPVEPPGFEACRVF